MPEDLLGDRAHHYFADAPAAMRANYNEIDFFLFYDIARVPSRYLPLRISTSLGIWPKTGLNSMVASFASRMACDSIALNALVGAGTESGDRAITCTTYTFDPYLRATERA